MALTHLYCLVLASFGVALLSPGPYQPQVKLIGLEMPQSASKCLNILSILSLLNAKLLSSPSSQDHVSWIEHSQFVKMKSSSILCF